MQVKKAVFKNFGIHEYLEVNFVQGLNGVFGANGCGKSTVTDGLYAAITNDWNRFDGIKNDNIRDTADEKTESSVYIEAESGGVNWSLLRGLRPNKSELRIEGRPEGIHKTAEIQHALEEDLGLNMKMLAQYAFVAQGDMFSFLSETAGERAWRLGEIVPAFFAVLRRRSDSLLTLGTQPLERRAAILAELCVRRTLMLADRAFHGFPLLGAVGTACPET